MKPLATKLLVSLCFLLGTVNAVQVRSKPGDEDYSKFLIDANKPYVYLEVDHIGPRKPLRNDEPNTGIWLRLRNNCRLPIVVLAIGKPGDNAKEGVVLEDEIVPDPQGQATGGDGITGGVVAPRELEQMMDIFHYPNLTEEEIRSAEERQKSTGSSMERPRGYGSHNGFDSFVLTLISPGGQVYFSVPANHVSKTWHFEIPFRLALPNNSRIRPPYSYLAFYREDLKDNQGNSAPPAPAKKLEN